MKKTETERVLNFIGIFLTHFSIVVFFDVTSLRGVKRYFGFAQHRLRNPLEFTW